MFASATSSNLRKTLLGEIDISDDSMEECDDERTYETDFPPGNKNHVDENGIPFGYHEYFNSDGKPIRKFNSESSESESSKSDTSKNNW